MIQGIVQEASNLIRMPTDVVEEISGHEKVTRVFGQWPSFHDAEILRAVLVRRPSFASLDLELTVHVLAQNSAAHTLVTLRFGKVKLDHFADFNHQNVIDDLAITRDETSVALFAVDIPANNGLDLTFTCDSIDVVDVREYGADERKADGSIYSEL